MMPYGAGDQLHLHLHERVNVVSCCLEIGLCGVSNHRPGVLGEG